MRLMNVIVLYWFYLCPLDFQNKIRKRKISCRGMGNLNYDKTFQFKEV